MTDPEQIKHLKWALGVIANWHPDDPAWAIRLFAQSILMTWEEPDDFPPVAKKAT